jgi:low temperature requirement protein LtrA
MRTLATPWGVSIAVTGPLLVLGGLVHGTAREAIWGLAAALDLATPTLFQRRLRRMHIDADHLAERFGLFLLIALGESVVAVTTSTDPHHLTVAQAVAIAAAFALCAGLWWVYFHFAADAMRYALATAEVQLDITRFVLSFGHLAFIGSVIVVAVGLHETVHDPAHHLSLTVAALLYGGTATYLATFGFTRWAMFRQVSTTRLSAAAVVLVLLPAAPHLAGVISVLALAVVLTALNLAEYIQVQQRTSLVQAPA